MYEFPESFLLELIWVYENSYFFIEIIGSKAGMKLRVIIASSRHLTEVKCCF